MIKHFRRTEVSHEKPQLAGIKRFADVMIVDDSAARIIQEDCPVLHFCKLFCRNQIAVLFSIRNMNRDIVAVIQNVIEGFRTRNVVGKPPGMLNGNIGIVSDNVHP